MINVTQLGYLGIGVSDVEAWERFATHILGLQSNGRDDDSTLFLKMDEYHHRFALHPNGNDDVQYVGWEVADEHALRAMSAQLQAAGVNAGPGSAELAQVRRVVERITLNARSSIATEVFYGPLLNFDAPFASPRAISGFEAGTEGLGHIVLGGNDVDESLHFYRDV